MNHCTICGVYWRDSHLCKLDSEGEVETEESIDMVNSPPHYNAGEIECIDAIREALGAEGFRAYCVGNVLKYAWRNRRKNGDEDLMKASWYARMAAGDDPRIA